MDNHLTAEEMVERDRERLRNAPTIHQVYERERKKNQPTWDVLALGFGQILVVMLIIPMVLLYTVDSFNSVNAYYWGLGVAGAIALWQYDKLRHRLKSDEE